MKSLAIIIAGGFIIFGHLFSAATNNPASHRVLNYGITSYRYLSSKVIAMKLLSVLFVFTGLAASAQTVTYGNFRLVDQEIIYQKVSAVDSITLSKLEAYYKALPYVSNLAVNNGNVTFDVTDLTVDYKKFQFTQVGTPPVIQTGKYSGAVEVGAKDGRYRVTFHNIQLTGDIGYKKIIEKDDLTSYASKNNGTILSQDWCRPNMLGLLDQAFTDKLQYVEQEKKKMSNDW